MNFRDPPRKPDIQIFFPRSYLQSRYLMKNDFQNLTNNFQNLFLLWDHFLDSWICSGHKKYLLSHAGDRTPTSTATVATTNTATTVTSTTVTRAARTAAVETPKGMYTIYQRNTQLTVGYRV